MSRRRSHGSVLVLLATLAVLTGCADVEATPEPGSTPTRTATRPTAVTPTPPTTSTSSATPTRTPTAKPSATPTTSHDVQADVQANVQANPDQPKPKPASKALQVERKLDALGYPVGTVDGTITRRARQALCAWRETHGLPISRDKLTQRDVDSILTASARPVPTRDPGIYVNKTCQVLYQVVGKAYKRIVWVSTGAPGYETPNGTGAVWRKWAGWHESSLYEDAYMYDSIYFLKNRPGIALHGSSTNNLVHTYPDSHSCVRVWRPDIREIFRETPIGRKVQVYGRY